MALNLFTKTYQAEQQATTRPKFLICEQDDAKIRAFTRDIREKGGTDLAHQVERVTSGRE